LLTEEDMERVMERQGVGEAGELMEEQEMPCFFGNEMEWER
jgi:hypothetical protein